MHFIRHKTQEFSVYYAAPCLESKRFPLGLLQRLIIYAPHFYFKQYFHMEILQIGLFIRSISAAWNVLRRVEGIQQTIA